MSGPTKEGEYCKLPRSASNKKRARRAAKWKRLRQQRWMISKWRDYHWKRQHGRCFYCQCDVAKDEATFDHIIPRSKGGEDHLENGVASCKPCNEAKGTMTQGEFVAAKAKAATLRVREPPP
jgi:5-methylcytosine-specific restriction endonuclease McrA